MTQRHLASPVHALRANFTRIYLAAIPKLLNREGCFLAFASCLAAVDALGSFGDFEHGNGDRFRKFVKEYFDEPYKPLAAPLWELRNAAIHSFSTERFALTVNACHLHLSTRERRTVLNAEDFYAALVCAAGRFFNRLENDGTLQRRLEDRLRHEGIVAELEITA